MLEFAIVAVAWLVGAALSVRFNAFALVPALLVLLVVVALSETSRGETIWWTAATMLLAAICAQFGYFAGSALRLMDENRRGGRRRENTAVPTTSKLPVN
jgi:hypothetical protein